MTAPSSGESCANRGHAGGLAVGGDGMLDVADTHTLFATPLTRAFHAGHNELGAPGLLIGHLRGARRAS